MPKVPSAHTEASLVPQNSNRIYNEFGRLANPNHLKKIPLTSPPSPLSINGEWGICGGQGQGEGGRELLIHDFCSEDAFSRFVGDELGVVADRTAESDFF